MLKLGHIYLSALSYRSMLHNFRCTKNKTGPISLAARIYYLLAHTYNYVSSANLFWKPGIVSHLLFEYYPSGSRSSFTLSWSFSNHPVHSEFLSYSLSLSLQLTMLLRMPYLIINIDAQNCNCSVNMSFPIPKFSFDRFSETWK